MQAADTAAIVAGGASGLGRAVVAALRRQGCRVAILDLDETHGARTAADTGALFLRCNVTSAESVGDAVAQAEAAHGVARICVNCAGIGPAEKAVSDDFQPHALDSFRRTFDINVVGTFNVATRFAARLIPAPLSGEERGVIINTSSVAAYDGQIGHAGYASSKAAVIGLTLPLAREFADHAIRVMTIAPGLFQTPMFDQNLSKDVQAALGAQVPFPRRLGHPDEFAMLVESIIANPMLNGEVIRLDGCLSLSAFKMADVLVSTTGTLAT